jgi:DNA-directed RNA polymerase specialized sigma24 family protein
MDYDQFVRGDARRVRRALIAYYGSEVGNEAADDAMALAWERWADIGSMTNSAGYVFRIGQSKAQRHIRWRNRRAYFPVPDVRVAAADVPSAVDLLNALARLRPDQRTAVTLVKSFGYTHLEVAELLGVSASAVNNLVHRAVVRLRTILEVSS